MVSYLMTHRIRNVYRTMTPQHRDISSSYDSSVAPRFIHF
jgi:hypothetical protein